MAVPDTHVQEYRSKGLVVLRSFFASPGLLDDVAAEVETLGRRWSKDFRLAAAAPSLASMPGEDRAAFYRALRYLPSVTRLAAHPSLLEVSRSLGLRLPAVRHSYNLRMDPPGGDRFLFHWHQDITYLLGSTNSLTYWIPLGRADREHGTIEVIPGSHARGVVPFHFTGTKTLERTSTLSPTDVHLDQEPTEPTAFLEADRGDLVVFSQFLLHRSTRNASDRVRWTVQIRHSDFADERFAAAGYPLGDATNIFFTDYLKKAVPTS
jgi:hypothetical protein